MIPQFKKGVENKTKIRTRKSRIRCRTPQLIENIRTSTNKSHKILKIPMTQNVSKSRKDFPVQGQSISSSKTEAIT